MQSPEQPKKQQRLSLHATRITTTSLSSDKVVEQTNGQAISVSGIANTASGALAPTEGKEDIVFATGALLKGGRYRLIKETGGATLDRWDP